jgi:hypothetical protein
MRKANILFMILFLFRAAVVPTDEAAIGEIRKLYAETAAAIARAQHGEGGGLYCNELIVNSRAGSWRAVGNYSKKVAFWYSDQPGFAAAEETKPEAVLVKVEVQETAAIRSLYREFLFAGGQLLFFFRKEKAGGDTVVEERIYFCKGKPLLRLLGLEKAAGEIETPAIFREAAYWQKLFLMNFSD